MAQPAPLLEPAFRDVIVIGASAGGVEALMTIARGLPEGLPATVRPRNSKQHCCIGLRSRETVAASFVPSW